MNPDQYEYYNTLLQIRKRWIKENRLSGGPETSDVPCWGGDLICA